MNLKKLRELEKEYKRRSLAFRKGMYMGVLAGTNDPKVRKEAEYKLRQIQRKINKKNRGKVKV